MLAAEHSAHQASLCPRRLSADPLAAITAVGDLDEATSLALRAVQVIETGQAHAKTQPAAWEVVRPCLRLLLWLLPQQLQSAAHGSLVSALLTEDLQLGMAQALCTPDARGPVAGMPQQQECRARQRAV